MNDQANEQTEQRTTEKGTIFGFKLKSLYLNEVTCPSDFRLNGIYN